MLKSPHLRLREQEGGVQNHFAGLARGALAEQRVSAALDTPGQDLLVDLVRERIEVVEDVLSQETCPLFPQKIGFPGRGGGELAVALAR